MQYECMKRDVVSYACVCSKFPRVLFCQELAKLDDI